MSFSLGDNNANPAIHYSCPLKEWKWPYISCSTVYLNDCYVNDKGVLRARARGAFGRSCKDCSYDANTGNLKCSCGDGNGGTKDTSVNVGMWASLFLLLTSQCFNILPSW
ncbi:uncharacterized protein CTRU02_204206 [Colletotrichum truncatum]|uniref:Uncharacterized protein n=1 Tax=Colletotrichum truncatum TaxID=5467 RepID=A0ACC3ZBB2_COLTU|nr:uncharacterized protein CTRU02_10059 [Colletotrichum truncatum]KAF6787764.1 hypothetical protein CTRU02_10059 [Colletotrichum truncatum]